MPKKGILLHLSHVNRVDEIKPFELKIIDALNESDYSVWQHLPINPPGKYNSPYSALSTFAGDLTLLSEKIEIKKTFTIKSKIKMNTAKLNSCLIRTKNPMF